MNYWTIVDSFIDTELDARCERYRATLAAGVGAAARVDSSVRGMGGNVGVRCDGERDHADARLVARRSTECAGRDADHVDRDADDRSGSARVPVLAIRRAKRDMEPG